MTFRDIIGNCDRLYPNLFSFDEKFEFCEELSAMMHCNYFIDTDTIELTGGVDNKLPDNITPDRIKTIAVDGVSAPFNSIEHVLEKYDGKRISVEYINIPHYLPDDKCPVSPPFDGLYTYYVIAKICLHSEYIAGYNNYMALFNNLMLEFKRKFSQADIDGCINFKNLW